MHLLNKFANLFHIFPIHSTFDKHLNSKATTLSGTLFYNFYHNINASNQVGASVLFALYLVWFCKEDFIIVGSQTLLCWAGSCESDIFTLNINLIQTLYYCNVQTFHCSFVVAVRLCCVFSHSPSLSVCLPPVDAILALIVSTYAPLLVPFVCVDSLFCASASRFLPKSSPVDFASVAFPCFDQFVFTSEFSPSMLIPDNWAFESCCLWCIFLNLIPQLLVILSWAKQCATLIPQSDNSLSGYKVRCGRTI